MLAARGAEPSARSKVGGCSLIIWRQTAGFLSVGRDHGTSRKPTLVFGRHTPVHGGREIISCFISTSLLLGDDELWELLLETVETSREQVDVIEAFFKDDSALKDSMALILVVHHKHLVRLVPENVQLGELLISLDVLCRETDGI